MGFGDRYAKYRSERDPEFKKIWEEEKQKNEHELLREDLKMEKVSGYELSIIFDTNKKLTTEESDELCDKVMELFESSDIVSLKLNPIIEEE